MVVVGREEPVFKYCSNGHMEKHEPSSSEGKMKGGDRSVIDNLSSGFPFRPFRSSLLDEGPSPVPVSVGYSRPVAHTHRRGLPRPLFFVG